jgi:hypothetical protein
LQPLQPLQPGTVAGKGSAEVQTIMKEAFEFRVLEKYAPMLFADDEGKRLGSFVRKIEIESSHPKFQEIGRLDQQLSKRPNEFFFAGWIVRRRYKEDELNAAPCFQLTIMPTFEPAGEQCGTIYDESAACPKCGAGAPLLSDLRLDLRKVPKNKDLARTIAGEWIVSQRLAERLVDGGLTGFELRRVRHKARYQDDLLDLDKVPTGHEIIRRAEAAGAPLGTWQFSVWSNRPKNHSLLERARAEYIAMRKATARLKNSSTPVWYLLVVTSACAEIVPPTRIGDDPFNHGPEGEHCCPLGDTIGLNVISEVSVLAQSRGNNDIVCTRQFIGDRAGVLRPKPLILVSPRAWKLFEAENVKGAYFEVVHLV